MKTTLSAEWYPLTTAGLFRAPKLEIRLDKHTRPASYKKWAAIFFFLSPAFDNLVTFIFRLFYKYSTEMREQVVAELIERRRLAQEMTEIAEVTTALK
jgi:hypothetical protein